MTTNAEWVREKIKERGWTELVEAEAHLIFMARWEADLWHNASSSCE